MADQKLTALTALASLSADDLFYVVDDPAGAAIPKKLATSVLDARFATAAQGALAATALQPADIGVTVQGYDADLATIAGLAKADGNFIVGDGAAWVVESGATVRTSLGLAAGGAGDIWVEKAGDTMTGLLTYAQPAASDGNKFYCVDPNDPNAALFNWHVWESNNVSGRRNTGINWGYNQTAGGAVETGGESAFWQQIEVFYTPSDSQMEYHWNFAPAGVNAKRPFHLNMGITGATAGYHDAYWYLDRMTWLDRVTQTFVGITLTLDTNAAGSLLDVNIPSTFGQQLSFDGTTHAGLKLNSLTTTQKNALTPAAGMLLYDTTLTRMQGYIAGAWATLYSAGGTDVAIADGGTGQGTAQAAIDALSSVAAATNEHVLTKDTATGNAIFKAAAGGGTSLPVADTQTIVMGSADNTKLLRFEVDGFTAGATRVMTPPDQNTLLAGQDFANRFIGTQTILAKPSTGVFLNLAAAASGAAIGYGAIHFMDNTETARWEVGIQPNNSFYIKNNDSGFNLWFADITNNKFSIGAEALVTPLYYMSITAGTTPTSGAAFGDTLGLHRANASGVAYGQTAALTINRWEDSGTPLLSRTGLKISLSHGATTTPDVDVMFLRSDGRIGIGENTPTGQLHVEQASTTAAIPALWLRQADLSEEFIRFETTVGAGNSIDTAALGAYYGKVRVYVNGVGAKWLALYD